VRLPDTPGKRYVMSGAAALAPTHGAKLVEVGNGAMQYADIVKVVTI